MRKNRFRPLAFVAAIAGTAMSALAQSGPPAMGDVDFPVSPSSIGEKIAAAGAVILLIVFATAVGFILVKRLFSMLTRRGVI